jgi:hypothetical protein
MLPGDGSENAKLGLSDDDSLVSHVAEITEGQDSESAGALS